MCLCTGILCMLLYSIFSISFYELEDLTESERVRQDLLDIKCLQVISPPAQSTCGVIHCDGVESGVTPHAAYTVFTISGVHLNHAWFTLCAVDIESYDPE